jgi:gliding motility-associated-like protein
VGPTFGAYHWTVQGGEVLAPATGRTVQVRWTASGTKRVGVSGVMPMGCYTDEAFKYVTIGTGPLITGPATYCREASTGLRYTIAGPPAAYQWSILDGTLVSGQGTNSVVVDVVPGALAVLQAVIGGERCPSALRIALDDRCLNFFNIITPNGDGQNDAFVIRNLQYYPNTSLTVFNRWGQQLYESRDYRNTYRAEGASAGVYYYLCQLENGTRYKGWFEVVK